MKAKLLANRHKALIVDPNPEQSTVLELRMVEQGFAFEASVIFGSSSKLPDW